MLPGNSALLEFRHSVRAGDVTAIRRIVAATGKFHEEELAIAVELVEERLSKGSASGYEFVVAEVAPGAVRGAATTRDLEVAVEVADARPQAVGSTRVVGFACYGKIPCTRCSYDLYWIAVDPAEQGRGIGKRLLSAVEKQLRELGATQLYADTSGRPDYADTRRYYLASGFQQAALLPDFYAPGDDKVIYRKLLS